MKISQVILPENPSEEMLVTMDYVLENGFNDKTVLFGIDNKVQVTILFDDTVLLLPPDENLIILFDETVPEPRRIFITKRVWESDWQLAIGKTDIEGVVNTSHPGGNGSDDEPWDMKLVHKWLSYNVKFYWKQAAGWKILKQRRHIQNLILKLILVKSSLRWSAEE